MLLSFKISAWRSTLKNRKIAEKIRRISIDYFVICLDRITFIVCESAKERGSIESIFDCQWRFWKQYWQVGSSGKLAILFSGKKLPHDLIFKSTVLLFIIYADRDTFILACYIDKIFLFFAHCNFSNCLFLILWTWALLKLCLKTKGYPIRPLFIFGLNLENY